MTTERMKEIIEQGRTALGIELGSTRIKAVLIDEAAPYSPRGFTIGKTPLPTTFGRIPSRKSTAAYSPATHLCGSMFRKNSVLTCRTSVPSASVR